MACVRYHTAVPAHTEAKIHQLCAEALAAKTEADVERIIPQLRAALQEHVRLAKASLEGQVTAIAALDTLKGPTV
jgi:F0F1-type ATP synthase membrane subunit b/b'